MRGGSKQRRAFTLAEVLASIVLLSVGIVGVEQGLGAMSRADARLRDSETMLRLASDKYQELVTTSASLNAGDSGDFTDHNEKRFQWTSSVDSTTTTNLIGLTVTVNYTDDPNAKGVSVYGVVYQAPTATALSPRGQNQ